MPYRSNSDLPASVQAHLPPHAQDICREAFNHAFAAHAGDPRQEEVGGGQALVREGRRQLDRPRANLTYLNVSAASRGILGNKSQEKDP